MYRHLEMFAMWLLEALRILPRLDPVLVQTAGSGCASKEWLRAHPREASAAGYVLIDGELQI